MAHSVSARKRVRQNERRRTHNKTIRSALRTQMRRVLAALKESKPEAVKKELVVAYRMLDMAAKKHIVHPNKAARHKSRLTRRANALAAP
ncbi:MAG: 30S ribosomal protein S20, partial [Planctomycetota bacterium]|nr:30S ribosomal protein S20 [Planctomycetota bacterium]